jgi:hypothetical protein
MISQVADNEVFESLSNSRASTSWKQAFAIRGSVTPHVLQFKSACAVASPSDLNGWKMFI